MTASTAGLTIEVLAVIALRELSAHAIDNVAGGAVAETLIVELERLRASLALTSLVSAGIAVLHAHLAVPAAPPLGIVAGRAAVAIVVGAVPAAAAVLVLGGVAVFALGALTGLVLAGGAVIGALLAHAVSGLELTFVTRVVEALEVGAVLAGRAVAEACAGRVAVAASLALVPIVALHAVETALSATAGPRVEVLALGALGHADAVDEGSIGASALAELLDHALSLALVALS